MSRYNQVTFTPSGSTPVQLTERQRWDYRNKDETWSILLTHDTVILQTTAYTRFEDFAERLRMAVHTVLAESEHDRLGVVHRVGLRYIDVVRASGGKDFRFYLRPGLHTPRAEAAPRAEAGELVTLIDMDHFVEGNFDADPDWVVAWAYELHDHIIETFQGHVVTEDAIEEWK